MPQVESLRHPDMSGFDNATPRRAGHSRHVEHDFPDIGHRKMLLNGRRILHKGTETLTILLAIEDITDK
jgi:hypothetical protein